MTVAAMWEARAAAGRAAELAAWVRESALPGLRGAAGLERLELLSAPGERVLLIAWWNGEPVPVADPPAELLGRPVHCWAFTSEHVEQPVGQPSE
ncbi:hypothetical protein ACGF0D_08625 [Kitasatospora sp. NPDC048298]|uniref:hypothetical protein n=1 Tax=Kitasatospora sp. NPDC048298 TaxID=3364049 RepID=UPI003718F641